MCLQQADTRACNADNDLMAVVSTDILQHCGDEVILGRVVKTIAFDKHLDRRRHERIRKWQ
jgi:hypothetical protein